MIIIAQLLDVSSNSLLCFYFLDEVDNIQYIGGSDCSGVTPVNGLWLSVPDSISANTTAYDFTVAYPLFLQ